MVLRDDFHRKVVLQNLDVGVLAGSQNQFLLNLVAGDVLMVQDAELGVSALFGQGELARLRLVEIDSPLHQFHHAVGGLADGDFHDVAVGQLVACDHRVVDVLLIGVGAVHHRSDAALRIFC